MALNREFKVKNDLNVLGRILSGGVDLELIFSQATASFRVSAANTSTTFYISGGDALTLEGREGITTFADPVTETLVISGVNATNSLKGVASFDSTNFTVTDGAVSIATDGVSKTNIADSSVGKAEVDASDIVYSSGAINFTNNGGFSARTDSTNETIGINANNELYIPTGGVGNNQLATDAVSKSKIADSAVGKAEIDANDIVWSGGAINFTNANGFSARVDGTTIDINGLNNLYLKSIPSNVPIDVYGQGAIIQNSSQGLSANVDNSTIEINGNALTVKDHGITGVKLNSNVVDDSTLAYDGTSNYLKVKSGGITNSELAASSVDKYKIDAAAFIAAGNSALTFSNANGLSANYDRQTIDVNNDNNLYVKSFPLSAATGTVVYNDGAISYSIANGLSSNVDDSTIEISSNKLQVKDAGITNTKLQYSYITFADASANDFNINLGDTINFNGTQYQITTDASIGGNITFSLPSDLRLPGDLYVHSGNTSVRDLSVGGNLFVAGSATFQNTLVTTSSALSVINSGPTPALYVKNTNVDYDIASFYDGDGIEVLHVGGGGPGGGAVGINVGTPGNGGLQPDLVGLTVVGNISATEIIYTNSYGTSVDWYSVYTSVNATSGNWDSVYSVVQSLSDTWGFGGGSGTIVQAYSAQWNSVYSYVNTTSADFLLTDTDVRVSSVEVYNGTQSALRDVFTVQFNNNTGTISTFNDADITTVKYIVNIKRSTSRCALEVLATKNNGTWEGTVYGILDQDDLLNYTSDPVTISVTGGVIELNFVLSSVGTTDITVVGDAITGA